MKNILLFTNYVTKKIGLSQTLKLTFIFIFTTMANKKTSLSTKFPSQLLLPFHITISASEAEMVNFSNTIDYLATQMNNKTSFEQHNKERFIIIAGVKEWEWENVPFGVTG